MTIFQWRWQLKNLTSHEATAANKQKAAFVFYELFDCFSHNKTI
jgi:hypothetical protein